MSSYRKVYQNIEALSGRGLLCGQAYRLKTIIDRVRRTSQVHLLDVLHEVTDRFYEHEEIGVVLSYQSSLGASPITYKLKEQMAQDDMTSLWAEKDLVLNLFCTVQVNYYDTYAAICAKLQSTKALAQKKGQADYKQTLTVILKWPEQCRKSIHIVFEDTIGKPYNPKNVSVGDTPFKIWWQKLSQKPIVQTINGQSTKIQVNIQ